MGLIFHIYTALCSETDMPRKRSEWVLILKMLETSRKRLINWSQSIGFPIDGGFPRSRQTHRVMVNMFFNPNPAHRLRLVPIEGKSQDSFNAYYDADMNHSRSYH